MSDAPDIANLYYRICWTCPGGQVQRTPTAWPREQAYAVLKGAREIATIAGHARGYWLEVAPARLSFEGWE